MENIGGAAGEAVDGHGAAVRDDAGALSRAGHTAPRNFTAGRVGQIHGQRGFEDEVRLRATSTERRCAAKRQTDETKPTHFLLSGTADHLRSSLRPANQ